jgi:hypothetical protein
MNKKEGDRMMFFLKEETKQKVDKYMVGLAIMTVILAVGMTISKFL